MFIGNTPDTDKTSGLTKLSVRPLESSASMSVKSTDDETMHCNATSVQDKQILEAKLSKSRTSTCTAEENKDDDSSSKTKSAYAYEVLSRLKDAKIGSLVNIYAVVRYCRPPARSRGSGKS